MRKERLYILSSKRSQVLEPLPHGDLRVVIFNDLTGKRVTPVIASLVEVACFVN